MRRFILGVLSGLFLFSSVTTWAGSSAAVGELAPNWILPDINGSQISLYQEAEQGRTTVMVFWATWCSNCRVLLPKIEALDHAKGDTPVAFYLMNVWEDGDPRTFIDELNIDLKVVLQAENVAQRYNVTITPGIVVVGPDKRIKYVRQPSQNTGVIATQLQELLGIKVATTNSAPTPTAETPKIEPLH